MEATVDARRDTDSGGNDSPVGAHHREADQLLGKRWIALIVRTLLRRPSRFSELATQIGISSDRMLSSRLGELESCGIVERRVDVDSKPVRIEYLLTPKGRALEPLVRAQEAWADAWIAAPPTKED